MKTKVNQSTYNKVKKQLKTHTQVEVMKEMGLSRATISKISRSRNLDDYYTIDKPKKKSFWQKLKAVFSGK